MQTFYVLNLNMYGPGDWDHYKETTQASSAEDAAERCAREWDEDVDDGRKFDLAVAEHEDGRDAVRVNGLCRVTVQYQVSSTTPFTVEREPTEHSCQHGTRPIDAPCEVCDAE